MAGGYNTDGVLIDDALGFGLCGGHGGWADGRTEEAAEERNGGRGCCSIRRGRLMGF